MNKLIFATVVLASCNSDRESLLAMSCYVCVVAVIVVVVVVVVFFFLSLTQQFVCCFLEKSVDKKECMIFV